MPRQKRQAGGRKEAPLAGVGNNDLAQHAPSERIYTFHDAEYQRLSELLQGFFQKLTRWREIAQGEGYCSPDKHTPTETTSWKSSFHVLQTSTELQMEPTTVVANPNTVLTLYTDSFDAPTYDIFRSETIIKPGKAGKQLLVDMDNMPIEEVRMTVLSQCVNSPQDAPWSGQKLAIRVTLPPDKPGRHGRLNHYREADYILEGDTLRVSHAWHEVMTDSYATQLFNTIDSLIPTTTSPTQQTEQHASLEPLPVLPHPNRRPTG